MEKIPVPDQNPRQSGRNKDFNQLTQKEVLTLLKKLARSLGRTPTCLEFTRFCKGTHRQITMLFGGYGECLRQAGFEARGAGYELSGEQLLADWVEVARKLGRVPSVLQYERAGKYSLKVFTRRWESWHAVPAAVLKFAKEHRRQEWQDVIGMTKQYIQEQKKLWPKPERKQRAGRGSAALAKKAATAPVYGRPLVMQALATAPVNEMGVVFLFASLATQLGFVVQRLQAEFPDCEALRMGPGDRWRRVRIEFEFESRNFMAHRHNPKGCDLIVCWKHNWPGCPLEVIELSKLMEG